MQPKLRFPEFSGNWNIIQLGDTIDSKTKWSFAGGPFGSNLKAEDYVNTGVRVIQLQNIGDGHFIDDSKIYVTEFKADQLLSCNIYPNDILISKMGDPVARCCIVPSTNSRYVMCSDGIRLVVDKNRFCSLFVYQVINDETFRKNALTVSTGSTRKRIGLSDLKSLSLLVPNLEEQTKIADFLSTVDKKIMLLEQQQQAWQTYKQGMMQKLFSGELRFKDENGQDFPEWEYLSLKSILDYQQPTKFIVNSVEYNDSYMTPVLTAGKSFILGYTNEETGIYEAQKNPVIIFDDFTTDFRLINFDFKVKSSAIKILSVHNKKVANIKYIYEIMTMINFPKGAEHKRYWISEYSELEVAVADIKEQQKIAGYLSGLDAKIDNITEQLYKMREWKKGLLQQMFV